MEPHREERQKSPPPSTEEKKKRFRIVKLEDRIAPKAGGNRTNNCYHWSKGCPPTGPACTVY
jgi:hypothetical protein